MISTTPAPGPATLAAVVVVCLAAAACAPPSSSSSSLPSTAAAIDPEIARVVNETKAIDHHAHPVRPTDPGEPADTGYDALPVENLEPASDFLGLRPGRPEWAEASRVLFNGGDRASALASLGANYATTMLDRMGIEKMVANRVAMGPGLPPERFLWAGYVDALMYPFLTDTIADTPDRRAFFALEQRLLEQYYREANVSGRPASLDDYLSSIVNATLERHRRSGAIAEKFEMAYLRSLAVGNPTKADAERAWQSGAVHVLQAADYRVLQDFIFRHIVRECGRLGMAVHLHTGEGGGGYYDVAGSSPGLLEPLFNDATLRQTRFVIVHGGWPVDAAVPALLTKPNVYVDLSVQGLVRPASEVARTLRVWLDAVPEKVMFGTDAYPYAPSEHMGWEEMGYVSAQALRRALAEALTTMVREGSVSHDRAGQLAHMVLRDTAAALYGIK